MSRRRRDSLWDIYFIPIVLVILTWLVYTAWRITEIAHFLKTL